MNYSTMTEREVEIELSTTSSEGLSSFTAHDRLIENGRNMPEKTYTKSVLSVFLSQFTNIYTLAYIVMGVITAVLGFNSNRIAWIIFFAVAVINTVSGFLRDYKDREHAVNFDKRRADNVKIIRDGKHVESDPTLLVKGDIVVLEQGDFVPCDIRILECENLIADESIFKGRTAPRHKASEKVYDEEDPAECKNILYCGSVISAGSAIGAAVATGNDTVLAKVNANNSKKLDLHDKFGKNSYSEKILTCFALLCAMLVLTVTMLKTGSFSVSMLQACTVAMCVLPAPVCIVRKICAVCAAKRLKRDQVSMEDDDFIYDIGMSEYFLFDKGGVITNNDIKLEEKVVSDKDDLKDALICSDCEYTDGKLTGSVMDKAVADFLIDDGCDVEKILKENEKILFMPYDEKRMLMACVVKAEHGYRLIVKGSVESMPMLCNYLKDGGEILEMNGDILLRLEHLSSEMAEKGLKIRMMAYKDMDCLPENIEAEIKGLTFTCLLGYREVIADNAKEAFEKLKSVFVKPVMVTGDGRVTVMAIAKEAGLITSEDECISFHEIGDFSDDMLADAADRYKVFSSATSNDRERLMRVLSEKGRMSITAGEQMTAPSAALYANATFSDGLNSCDVQVRKSDIAHISEAVYKAKTMRGNMAYSSLMAISVGFAEVLVMLYMLLTGTLLLPSTTNMLLLNMFVVFVPCLAVAVFASVHHRTNEGGLFAVKCMLQGVICALCAIASGESLITFIAIYSILDAGRVCVMFNNLKKGRLGAVGAGLMLIALLAALAVLKADAAAILFAIPAVCVNAVLPYIRLKGMK